MTGYQIDMPYACAGITVTDGIVTDTAPIFRWMIGKRIDFILSWANKKKYKINRLED
uniref:Uncharacterized protein n=1 Tax=viral metagenome TaxID=1070528 RepID=A0A6M3LG05_9ZZZZ